MKYIDLTQTFNAGMPVFPGDPQPSFKKISSLEKDGFVDYQITVGMHTGTHVDAPAHMLENGKTIADIPVEKFFGRGWLVDGRNKETIEPTLLDGMDIQRGDIVLVLTGWDKNFGKVSYYQNHPQLSLEFAQRLVELKVSMVGLDFPSPDQTPYPIHRLLLSKGILIMENLVGLERLLGISRFEVIALPAKWPTDAAPVRVVAILTTSDVVVRHPMS